MSPSRRSSLRAVMALLVAGPALAASPCPARASSLRMTVEAPHFICAKGGVALSHAAFHPGSKPDLRPALPCCDGQLGCAQFLSTSTVLHPSRRWHS